MSINVTVNGNRFNIRRGRMVLSDLEQIKKNERDRRRRLRLEQVRQQSKEISDRLLERTKNIAKEEFRKLEDDSKLKEIYNGKIMEVQKKYQEDMADIGQAHLSAALEPDHDALIEERERRNKSTAMKRGQEAIKQVKEAQQREALQQQQHQDRLRQVREVENLRSTMVAHLPKKSVPELNTICINIQNEIDEEAASKRTKKPGTKKSPVKIPKAKSKTKTLEVDPEEDNLILEEESVPKSTERFVPKSAEGSVPKSSEGSVPKSSEGSVPKLFEGSVPKSSEASVPKSFEGSVPKSAEESSRTGNGRTEDASAPTKADKSASGEQFREINQPRYVKCPRSDKVQVYDHSRHQKNVYDQPAGVVEKIEAWNEPSATDLAQEIERRQIAESHLSESRKQNAQKRGEDAVLREKVRRDYQTLMQNLDQLASEERKLKASQAANYPKDAYMQEERRRLMREQHKQKLNRAMKTLLDGECPPSGASRRAERQITLAPMERDRETDIRATWEDPSGFSQRAGGRDARSKRKEDESSREQQILDMLKKVERQKRLLLQEFGADLPSDVFNASVRHLFEKDKSVQTQPTDAPDERAPKSPEIKVIDASLEERSPKDKKKNKKERVDPPTKKKEIAVQTTTGDEIVQDKGTQVELIEDKEPSVKEDRRTRHHPLEPEVVILRPQVDTSDSTSSDTLREVPDVATPEKECSKVTPKKKRYSVKTAKQTPSKMSHRSIRKTVSKSPAKKPSTCKTVGPKKTPSKEDVPSRRIKMYVDKNGVNIKVKPPEVAEILVDVSTQCAQEIAVGTEKLGRVAETKQQWTHSKSLKVKDFSDTSTSFASPPPIRPRDILEALSNNMSILEMLDSSANESLRRSRRDVSPVSTPETPSPRTMRLPSNIPHPERIKKLFLYSSAGSQTNDYRQTSSSPSKTETSTGSSNGSEDTPNAYSKGPVSLEFCLCHNSDCKQMHAKFEEIHSYALKNCPQILQKYEELQNTCAERIVSLTNLIEKVRNEQKGMEFSVIDPDDDTSLMQLPPSQIPANDLETVHRLVENIEAIHNQLAKTLMESQKIIKTKTVVEESEEIKETEKGISTEREIENKAKPRVVRVEKVDISMERFKRLTPTTSTPERDDKPSEEEVIERLSKEILEQSKGLNSNLITSKDVCASTVSPSVQTPTDNIVRIENSKVQTERACVRDSDKEAKGSNDFVPLLHDIPKVVSRIVDNPAHANGRSKPPVSLLSGPYRAEIDSSGHELSTIIEFDTPDTVNRSQGNVRSPLSARKVTETQIKKSTAIVKPSGHITPSRSDKLRDPTTAKLSQEIKEPSIFFDSPTTSKNVESQDLNKEQEDKILQCDTVDRGSTQAEECKDKDKITSTSSNSFSELSGVSQIASTPSSTLLRYASSPEEMETALKKLGLGWAITTLKKTREASALSSSSNSDTPINTAKRILSPVKKQLENKYGLLDFSDVSSISIKEASKSTEQAVLLKGRTSTPKLQQNSNSESNSSNTNNSENFQVPEEGLIIPNVSLTKTKSNVKNLENL